MRSRRALAAGLACAVALTAGVTTRASVEPGDPTPRSTNVEIEQRLLRRLGAANGAVARCSIAGGTTRDAWRCDVMDAPSTPEDQSVDTTYLVLENARGRLSVESYPIVLF